MRNIKRDIKSEEGPQNHTIRNGAFRVDGLTAHLPCFLSLCLRLFAPPLFYSLLSRPFLNTLLSILLFLLLLLCFFLVSFSPRLEKIEPRPETAWRRQRACQHPRGRAAPYVPHAARKHRMKETSIIIIMKRTPHARWAEKGVERTKESKQE